MAILVAMSVALWGSPTFLDEVRTWVEKAAVTHGLELTGEWEQPHNRPWSSAIRFETTGGRVWFKVNGPGTTHEAALVELLNRRTPGLAPELLGVDVERGWSLTRDGGPMLRTMGAPDDLWSKWETVLVAYAEAQILLAEHRDEVIGCGVPVVNAASIPAQARQLIDELSALPEEEGGLDATQQESLRAVLPQLDTWCAELAESPVPESVQHDDLHSSNICWDEVTGQMRIIDWGDATWGSPLGTMLATMNSVAWHAGVFEDGEPIDDLRVLALRDAYLEPFTRYADRVDLVRGVDLARRTGAVGKALSYQRSLASEPVSTHAELDFPVREWFLELVR